MAGIGALTLLIGTGTAWLVTMYRFPGRSVFQWLLLLPLAIPTYIIAYTYLEMLDYSGSLQTALRAMFGWHDAKDYWFPDIRSSRWRDPRHERGALSLCLHYRTGELHRAVGVRARGQPHARAKCGRDLLAGGAAAFAPGTRRRGCARFDGDAQRYRRRRVFRREDAHRRRLRHVARPQQPRGRRADRLRHANLRGGAPSR